MIKQPQLFYFDIKQVMPTKDDGVEVLAWHVGRGEWDTVTPNYLKDWFRFYSHWMQMPKAPSDKHEHAFLEG